MGVAADGLTLPFDWYSDEDVLRRERAQIFARTWQYGGRAALVDEPGSFLTTDTGGIPILVTRDRDGVLRAFLNVCRHRGAVLTEGCGTRATLQCHYHAWTYDLDGSLRTAPRADREPRFDPSELVARPRVASTRGGRSSSSTPTRTPRRSPSTSATCRRSSRKVIDVDAIVFHSRVDFGAKANWKIVVENFLECYHCPTAHPAFSAEVDVHPDRYLLEAHPTFGAQFARAKGTGDGGQFHLLYPNTGINVFPGPANLSIGPISPDGAHRTQRYLDYFFAAGVDENWIAEFFEFDDQVGREDTALVESVHRGMASRPARAGTAARERRAAARRLPALGRGAAR